MFPFLNFEQVNVSWEVDGWLHFIKWFSANFRIVQTFITQTFLETRNWTILSPKLTTRLITHYFRENMQYLKFGSVFDLHFFS